jgi:hypothetical protein
MSQNLANRVANAVSLKHRKTQLEAAEGGEQAASTPEPAQVEFFKHDPDRQKAYAEGRKRLTTMDNKRKY